MRTFARSAALIAAALTVAIALTGCSGDSASARTVESVAAVPASPTATVAAESAVLIVEPGTVLTAEQAIGCVASAPLVGCALPKGDRAYAMPDGTLIAVSRNKPLPAAVLEVLTAQIATVPVIIGDGYMDDVIAGMEASEPITTAATRATGKQVIAIISSMGSERCGPTASNNGFVIVSGGQTFGSGACAFSRTKEGALALAAKLIGVTGNDDQYVVLIAP